MIAGNFNIIQMFQIKLLFFSLDVQVSQSIVSLQSDEGQTVSLLLSLLLSSRCLSSFIVVE